jgi:predicted dehydrogenase
VTAPLGFGVIGTGMMGCEHIRNLLHVDAAEIRALSDPDESSRRFGRLAAGRGVPVYADHRALLDRTDVDAVVVASPNHTHVDVLTDVFASGKHVLVEKPMCTTVADCERVVAAAERHAGIVWVGLEYRYMPPIARLLEELARGAVGTLKMLSIREHRFPFLPKVGHWNRFSRNTGGTLVEKCCHFFDLMHLAVGREPTRVFASGGQDVNHLEERYDGEVPDILDNAFVIVDWEGGARTCLDLCMFAEASPNEQEIVATGDRGRLACTVPGGHLEIGTRKPGETRLVPIEKDPRVRHTGFHHGASYLEHLELIDAIRHGLPARVGVRDGLRSVALGVAAHRSIDTGRPVAMADLVGGA